MQLISRYRFLLTCGRLYCEYKIWPWVETPKAILLIRIVGDLKKLTFPLEALLRNLCHIWYLQWKVHSRGATVCDSQLWGSWVRILELALEAGDQTLVKKGAYLVVERVLRLYQALLSLKHAQTKYGIFHCTKKRMLCCMALLWLFIKKDQRKKRPQKQAKKWAEIVFTLCQKFHHTWLGLRHTSYKICVKDKVHRGSWTN